MQIFPHLILREALRGRWNVCYSSPTELTCAATEVDGITKVMEQMVEELQFPF